MNINDLQASESGFLQLDHPVLGPLEDDAGEPIGFQMYGRYSHAWRSVVTQAQSKASHRGQKTSDNDVLARLIISAHGLESTDDDGKTTKVTPDNVARLVFDNPQLDWIRTQVDKYVFDDSAFFSA